MTIYLETERTGIHTFQFLWGYFVGASSTGEKEQEWKQEDNDRLRAAIVNVGLAARELSETDTDVRVIKIKSDKDGKDFRYGGEHETLYSLLVPSDDFQARKMRSLYGDYMRYVSKVLELMLRWDIVVQLVNE